jgi:hypothetical protein
MSTSPLPPGPASSMACRWSKDQKQTLLLWDPIAQEWYAVSASQPGIPRSWRREATVALAEEKLRQGVKAS